VIRGVKPRVLIVADHYLPGWRAGGPIRSLANMVEALGGSFEFRVLTTARDLGQSAPYPGFAVDEWNDLDGVDVYYGSRRGLGMRRLLGLVRRFEPDIVFLNSLFSPLTLKVLLARRFGRLDAPVLLAPRGELAEGALGLRRVLKRLYRLGTRILGLLSDVTWQASSGAERRQVLQQYPNAEVRECPDVPRRPDSRPADAVAKRVGHLRLVTVSRIAPIKNLGFFIDVLDEVPAELDVEWEVFGPPDPDPASEAIVRRLRSHIGSAPIRYRGPLEPAEVEQAVTNAHAFVLPTQGENFGHAIFEALRLGRPVVISDRTPWRGLDRLGAGWDLPLESSQWVCTIEALAAMPGDAYRALVEGAHAYASRVFEESHAVEAQIAAFAGVMRHG